MSRRDELVEVCRREPEKMADLILALEARVSSLEQGLNKTSKNSHQPPSSEGLKKPPRQSSKSKRKPGGQIGHVGQTLKFSGNPDKIIQHGADECQACGESLVKVAGAIKAAIRGSPVGHGDETSIRVEGYTRWLHVFSTLSYTYYYWSRQRGQKAHQADGLLADYDGILMHDAYRSYFGHAYEHALCNAHVLRELQAIYEADPSQRWTRHLMRLVRTAWAWVKRAKQAGDTQLPVADQDRILALFDQIVTQADQQNPPRPRQSGQSSRVAQSNAPNLLDRLIQYKAAYLRLVIDFRVPFDNNLAERDLRLNKLQ